MDGQKDGKHYLEIIYLLTPDITFPLLQVDSKLFLKFFEMLHESLHFVITFST